eukprot:3964909-Heterocapsa_arctica.AAC.1
MERRRSIGLLQALCGLLRRVLEHYTSNVHVRFEWPRHCFRSARRTTEETMARDIDTPRDLRAAFSVST